MLSLHLHAIPSTLDDEQFVREMEAADAFAEQIQAMNADPEFLDGAIEFELAKIGREQNERFEKRLAAMPWAKAETMRHNRAARMIREIRGAM